MKCFWCLFASYLRLFVVLSGWGDFVVSPAFCMNMQRPRSAGNFCGSTTQVNHVQSPLPSLCAAEQCSRMSPYSRVNLWAACERGVGMGPVNVQAKGVLVHKLLLVALIAACSKFFPHACKKATHTSPLWRVLPLTHFSVMQISFWRSDSRCQLISHIQKCSSTKQLTMKTEFWHCWLGTLTHRGCSSSPWREPVGISVAKCSESKSKPAQVRCAVHWFHVSQGRVRDRLQGAVGCNFFA